MGVDVVLDVVLKGLVLVVDVKGKKVGEEWWIISMVESFLSKYCVVVDKVSVRVIELFRVIVEDL